MANLMQQLRSLVTAVPSSLANGQIAYTANGDVAFIGSNGNVVAIGGLRVPGTLTANQALVANSTSGINRVYTANLDTNIINLAGSPGTAGYILTSNGTSNAYWMPSSGLSVNSAAQYTWTNTHNFQNTVTFGSNLVATGTTLVLNGNTTTAPTLTASANSTVAGIAVGNSSVVATVIQLSLANSISSSVLTPSTLSIGTTGANVGVYISNSSISVGNSTVNTFSNATHFYSGNSTFYTSSNSTAETFVNSTGNNTSTPISLVISNTTAAVVTANISGVYSPLVNSASFTVGTAFTANSTVVNAVALNIGNQVNTATLFVATSANLASTNVTATALTTSANVTLSGANTVIAGTNTAISANVFLTGASITGTSTDASIRNLTLAGNLTINGSLTTINAQTLTVNDNIVEFGVNNSTADVTDTGWFSPAGNSTVTWYSGVVRQASKSSNSNPYFWLFGSNTNPNTAITVDTSANSVTGTLQAYLMPWGTGGAFVVNSTAINITANSTVSSALVANSLTLSSAMGITSGGTGRNTFTNNALLVGNTAGLFGQITGTDGQVLVSVAGVPTFVTGLDGGTF